MTECDLLFYKPHSVIVHMLLIWQILPIYSPIVKMKLTLLFIREAF